MLHTLHIQKLNMPGTWAVLNNKEITMNNWFNKS